MHDMARGRKGNASVTLTIRMTREDRELLNRLVAKRSIELSDEGLDVTATSVIRGMIRREARGLGLLPPLGGPALGTPPPARIRPPRAADSQPSSVDAASRTDPYAAVRAATPPRLPNIGSVPMGNPTPMVPTGMGEPRELRPYVADASMPDSDEGVTRVVDADRVRERAVQAIRGRRFRQRDLVERAGVPQQVVSRFLLGAESSAAQLRAIAGALEKLDV
jgi:hypothetical protein